MMAAASAAKAMPKRCGHLPACTIYQPGALAGVRLIITTNGVRKYTYHSGYSSRLWHNDTAIKASISAEDAPNPFFR